MSSLARWRHVVAHQSVVGGELVASHHFFGADALQARRRYERHLEMRQRGLTSTLGASAPALVWKQEQPHGSDFTATHAERYAALASVSKNYSASKIVDYLNGHGWAVTFSWQQGDPIRTAGYAVDEWLASLPPDATDNHRWFYAEANRIGDSTTLGADAPWPLTLYHLAYVARAVPAPPTPPQAPAAAPVLPTTLQAAPSAPKWPLVLGGLVLGSLLTVVLGKYLPSIYLEHVERT